MTQFAPESRSITAEISPVWAPDAFAWQSCPPTATAEPTRICATVPIMVAGGQTSRSQPSPSAPRRSGPAIAAACSVSPFIFQLPAISWRMTFLRNDVCCSYNTPSPLANAGPCPYGAPPRRFAPFFRVWMT